MHAQDIFKPSRMVWMASSFSFLWSPFVCKILGSWESSFIKQSVIFGILRWTSFNFISVLLIEGDTEAKTIRFTSFAWENSKLSSSVSSVIRFLSAVSERYSLKTTDTNWFHCKDYDSFHGKWPHSVCHSLHQSELSGFSGSAVLLAVDLLALCGENSWVTVSINLLSCSIWHFECLCSWIPIEVRVFCKTLVKALNSALLPSMIFPVARELGVV